MPSEKLYIVQQLYWQWDDMEHVCYSDQPVKAFRDRKKAEAYCWEVDGWFEEWFDYDFLDDPTDPITEVTTRSETALVEAFETMNVPHPPRLEPSTNESRNEYNWTDKDWWAFVKRAIPFLEQRAILNSLFDKIPIDHRATPFGCTIVGVESAELETPHP
ncbi:MAG: hypothetical protein ACFCD0_24375 [Gemmataceae bacterium]